VDGQRKTIIIGAGVIGLSIAWRLCRRGEQVLVLERGQTGQEASRVAAGMLAAAAEVGFEEPELYALCRASLKRWPSFASELEAESGMSLDYSSFGTLIVADDRDATEALRRGYQFQKDQGYPVDWLSGAEALEKEPFLSPRVVAAVSVPEDHSVDNRKLLQALVAAINAHGGDIREQTAVEHLDFSSKQIRVETAAGDIHEADRIVVAAGAWSAGISGLSEAIRPPVRPVKGQILELKMVDPFALNHVIRGPKAYLVPRKDGRLIVGATSEEMGFDRSITVGAIHGILDGAWEVVPGILDQEILSIDVGFRPASRDHQPMVGFTADPRVFMATGHYRHGIVLSAVTATVSEQMLLDGSTDDVMTFFSPLRFDSPA